MELLKKDDIVTVINKYDMLYECQGKVLAINSEKEVIVYFGVEFDDFGIYFDDEEKRLSAFDPEFLRKEDDFSPETKACQLFGDDFPRLFTNTVPFSTENDCQVEDCPKKAIMRGMVNIAGNVCNVDFCEEHKKKYHGTGVESFPWKENE